MEISLKAGERIQILLEPDRTYTARIHETFPQGLLIADAPTEPKDFLLFRPSREVVLHSAQKDALYAYAGTILRRERIRELTLLVIQLTAGPDRIQRRAYYRVHTFVDAQVMLPGANAHASEPLSMTGHTLDISGGGMKLRTPGPLPEGAILPCRLTLKPEQAEEVSARVIASSEASDDSKTYISRLEFLEVPKEVRERIIAFVFETQRRLRRKGML